MIEIIVLDKDLYQPSDLAPKTAGSAGLDLKLSYSGLLAGDVKDAPEGSPGAQRACSRVHEAVRFPWQAKLATSATILQVLP